MLDCTEHKKKRTRMRQSKHSEKEKKSGMYEISVSISTFHVCTNRRKKRNTSIDL